MSSTNVTKKLFPYSSSTAYPAANAIDGGQVNSEDNLKYILKRITRKSYTLTTNDLKLTGSGNNLYISHGTANIDGYCFVVEDNITVNLPSILTEYDMSRLSINGVVQNPIYVVLSVCLDGSAHILTKASDDTNPYYQGICIRFETSQAEILDSDLLLGYVNISSTKTVLSCQANLSRTAYIDSDSALYSTQYGSFPNYVNVLVQNSMAENAGEEFGFTGATPTLYLSKTNQHLNSLKISYNTLQRIATLSIVNGTANSIVLELSESRVNCSKAFCGTFISATNAITVDSTGIFTCNGSATFNGVNTFVGNTTLNNVTVDGTFTAINDINVQGTILGSNGLDIVGNSVIGDSESETLDIYSDTTFHHNVKNNGNLVGTSSKTISGFGKVYNAVWN